MKTEIRRGWALTALLIIVVVMAVVATVAYVLMLIGSLPSALPHAVLGVLLAACLLRDVSAVAIWLWIKEGVILYVFLTLVVIPLTYSLGFRSSAISVVGVGILMVLIWDKWPSMRWLLVPANHRWRGP